MRPSVLSLFSGAVLVALAGNAGAQLTDLQPGRNFSSENQFGLNHSENIDPGDCDNDGDLDVIVGNGGDQGIQPSRIFINLGGLQGGTVGTWSEQTSTRFAGLPNSTSRDIEFMDLDNDADLDVYIANRGGAVTGEVSRFLVNNGGLQAGTIGFYTEETNTRWGSLVSVPLGDQVFGGNAGPWRDWSCDCDFADLNDDGHSDLFHSSYGPAINGSRPSRVFNNDGAGVFNEQFPWVNAGADIATHTIDLDLCDLDGDFDIDVFMSSRDSQARTYMNNLYNGISASPFNDITQTAIIATGAVQASTNHYTAEFGDIDGDGDFDQWMKNYAPPSSNADRILINNGFVAGVGYNFTMKTNWIKGDPNADENEADFGDYDNDGDLDMFVANFGGANSVYQSGLAQGLNADTQGLYHNTGIAGTLAASFPENPSNYGGGQELDADWADIDNDGDEDILVANDAGQQNRLFRSVLGVPDSHAPTFEAVTAQADKANGTSTVIHAAVRDNSSYYLLNFYPTFLKYTVQNGVEQSVQMKEQGSMQFRGVIPAQIDAHVQYHIETEDMAGNTAASIEECYEQGSPPELGTWTDLGFALAGLTGLPVLAGTGTQLGGCDVSINLTNARTSSPAVLFVGLSNNPTAFKGGTLIPIPLLLSIPFTTSGAGTIPLPFKWPSGLPAAFDIFYQYGIQDAAAVQGVALSNALQSTTP